MKPSEPMSWTRYQGRMFLGSALGAPFFHQLRFSGVAAI